MKNKFVFLYLSLSVAISLFAIYFVIPKNKIELTNATGDSSTITTEGEWNAQTKDANIDTATVPGSVILASTEAYNSDGVWSCDKDCVEVPNVHDRDTDGTFGRIAIGGIPLIPTLITHTFSEPRSITRVKLWLVRVYEAPVDATYNLEYWDGDSWVMFFTNTIDAPQFSWDVQDLEVNLFTSAIRIIATVNPDMIEVYEMEDYSPTSYSSPGVIVSSPTQLDAGVHESINWTTFAPSGTIPANTSMSFRFRTSPDASTWSAWSSSTPYAASIDLSSSTQQRYLQVETTLSNTVGSNTPVLDSYTANYDYTDAPVPTCEDGLQNGSETGVDCGGSCAACPVEPTCIDGIQNGAETGVDCGGSCSACPVEPTCEDGAQNGSETGVDCGGSCAACPAEPTCNDGVRNGSETGVDCGGACTTCPVPPTCSDGIQNGAETRVDCGGSCTACPKQCQLTECQESASASLQQCQESASNNSSNNNVCWSNYCSASRQCYSACGILDGKSEFANISQPNGGESYNISESIPVKWYYTDSDHKTRLTESLVLTLSLSLDGGQSYFPIKTLVPANDSSSPVVAHSLKANNSLEKGTYTIDITHRSYTYTWIPGTFEYVTDHARLKLEPEPFNCMIKMNGDASDNDFELYARQSQLSVSLEPSNAEGYPGDKLTFIANTSLADGSDVTAKSKFSFTTSKGATIDSSLGNKLVVTASEESGFFDQAILVQASYLSLSASAYSSINILESPVVPPREECGVICDVVGSIKSFIDETVADESKRNLISFIALVAGLINLALNSIALARDMIAPFIKGKDKKNTSSLVYDASTGLPIERAKILLINQELGNLAGMTVSDKDGRYALDLSPHKRYKVQIELNGYKLVERSLHHFEEAGLAFANNYFGEEFIAGDNQLNFTKNLPVYLADTSALSNKIHKIERLNNVLIGINIPITIIGSGVALIILSRYPIMINYLVCALYILALSLFLIRNMVIEGRGSGVVKNVSRGEEPVDLALIRAIRAKDQKLMHTVLSDHEGRYSLTLPKGIYSVYAAKTGLAPSEEVSITIRSSFKPSVTDIEMREANENNLEKLKAEANSAVIPAAPSPIMQTISEIDQTSANSADDIIDRYHPPSVNDQPPASPIY